MCALDWRGNKSFHGCVVDALRYVRVCGNNNQFHRKLFKKNKSAVEVELPC